MTDPAVDKVDDSSPGPEAANSQKTASASTRRSPAKKSAGGKTPAAKKASSEDENTEEASDKIADDVAQAEADKSAPEPTKKELIEAAQAEAKEWQDKFLRLHAEWDTYRRRTNEQRSAERIRATEKLVESLIPVIDDFERTIDYAEKNGETGLLGGVQAVYTKLLDVLQKDGVEIIDPAGEAFDALEQQAVGTVPDEEAFDETVKEVYQKGYKMGTKVIRAAMVTVSTGGPKRPKEE